MRIISCPHCDMKYRIDPSKFARPELKIRCKKCGTGFTVNLGEDTPAAATPPATATPTPTVSPAAHSAPTAQPHPARPAVPGGRVALIAHESAELRAEMRTQLEENGFIVEESDNGVDALIFIERSKPAVAILDVALPKMFGFEVCEIVRRDPALESVKLILIAAIYDRARYKRAPTNLYGADDYIEKHHIPDSLAEKCLRLVGTERAPSSSASTPRENREEAVPRIVAPAQEQQEEASRERIRTAESRPRPDEAMLERARRLARTIVSDIALYNQEKIVEGVRNNNLREVLADEIEEGRQLLAGRLAPDIRDAEPFLDTAIEQLIAAKKKELGIA